MSITLYNTLTQAKEPLETVEPQTVKIYSCGPTVYNYFHIGNARAFVVPDVLKRYLAFRGYRVIHVQNVTDIEDKIIRQANELGVSYREVVDRFTQAFFDDLALLGCLPADVHPKATEHIPQIIELIQRLIERGLAYVSEGDVYYDVSRFERYGRLSKQSPDELIAGARVASDERKQDPLDFALWKAAKPGEPYWESPWGPGRPGWHIECSAMSMTYLGESFDIHTGGADLVFPHHENEIAQSEGATGRRFVRYWLHNGYINVDGAKMSKSLGNFIVFRDLAQQYDPEVLRAFLISKHYRSPIDLTQEALDAQARGMERLHNALQSVRKALGREPYPAAPPAAVATETVPDALTEAGKALWAAVRDARERFVAAMDDDLNTPAGLAALFDLARESNRFLAGGADPRDQAALAAVEATLHELGGVLGILQRPLRMAPAASSEIVDELLRILVDVRQAARNKKDWATADAIRDRLKHAGVILEDTPDGTIWKFER